MHDPRAQGVALALNVRPLFNFFLLKTGVQRMTREHLGVALALKCPVTHSQKYSIYLYKSIISVFVYSKCPAPHF
jgi:hypothetical protein